MKEKTLQLTTAQALVLFLKNQFVSRDGKENPFFAGMWGILGHGNLAGLGEALQEYPDFPYYQSKNEQAQVHIAAGYAKMKNRLQTFACTSSIGPGATNMVTGAALATINRLPVLLLPGDIFAKRKVAPVLQQLEQPYSLDLSVNDAFRPVSRYFDRIYRPDQLPFALMEAMRILTSPADTGAVTLALPQDTQAEAYPYPASLFKKRVWFISRPEPEKELLFQAVSWIKKSEKPFIIAGGGVIYSEATSELKEFVEKTGIPVGETQAGKGALPWDSPQNLGALGATGGLAANLIAREADLVLALGTRLTDFSTASKTAFQNPKVKFININVAAMDAYKHQALPLLADIKKALPALLACLPNYHISKSYHEKIQARKKAWQKEIDRQISQKGKPLMTQAEVIGTINRFSSPQDVVVCASGSLPGDLHKLWRPGDEKGYHLEYGYSCMGYEIAGALGVKMAAPNREVYCLVGDGAFLMMSSEIATAVQEEIKITVILFDNHGFASIGGLSSSLGSEGFGTHYCAKNKEGSFNLNAPLPLDFVKIAEGYGAHALRVRNRKELRQALQDTRKKKKITVIVLEVDREKRVPSYASWWDVPPAEISKMPKVRKAYKKYKEEVTQERFFF